LRSHCWANFGIRTLLIEQRLDLSARAAGNLLVSLILLDCGLRRPIMDSRTTARINPRCKILRIVQDLTRESCPGYRRTSAFRLVQHVQNPVLPRPIPARLGGLLVGAVGPVIAGISWLRSRSQPAAFHDQRRTSGQPQRAASRRAIERPAFVSRAAQYSEHQRLFLDSYFLAQYRFRKRRKIIRRNSAFRRFPQIFRRRFERGGLRSFPQFICVSASATTQAASIGPAPAATKRITKSAIVTLTPPPVVAGTANRRASTPVGFARPATS
jgi:hypothetical protein